MPFELTCVLFKIIIISALSLFENWGLSNLQARIPFTILNKPLTFQLATDKDFELRRLYGLHILSNKHLKKVATTRAGSITRENEVRVE